MDVSVIDPSAGLELEQRLTGLYGSLDGPELLESMIKKEFPGRIAVSSSFGIEAAALLDLVAEVDASTPVIFLETGTLFPETLAYRDTLTAHFGLSDVRSVTPDPADIEAYDAEGNLYKEDTNTCCHLRKVLPLGKALHGFDAWVTGRKRFHGEERADLKPIEFAAGKIKINPLVGWSQDRIKEIFEKRGLPRHPLGEAGYPSVGCAPCTSKSSSDDGVRAGRWADIEKTECGIHNAPWVGQGI